jgi:hypothetical protein
MKPLLAVLVALSVVANFVLVGVLLVGRNAAKAPAPMAVTSSAPTNPRATQEIDSGTWATLAADELPAMVEQLRTAGIPSHFVRALVAARVQEMFAARFKALRPDAASQTFWKNAVVDPRIRAEEFKLYREQQKMLRELLGADAEPPETSIYSQRRFETVPAAKLDEVKDALRQFEERRQEVYSTVVGVITPEHQRKVAALEKEHQATMAQILTPAELEEFNVRNSDVARSLRNELAAFNPTEKEFRAIYKLQSQIEPFTPNMSQEESQRRGEAYNQAREQFKAMLGPDRAAEYVRASDFSYRQTSQLVSRLELPPETTTKVWDVKQDIEKRANELRRQSSLPPEERTKQLAALAEEGTTRVTELVGKRGIEAYKQQGGGFWLQGLAGRPGSTTTDSIIWMRGP